MANMTVRNLSEDTRRALKERAARNDRSMEAEARAILDDAVRPQRFVADWLDAAQSLRSDGEGGPDLPARSRPRPPDLT